MSDREITRRCQYIVRGTEIVGIIYITASAPSDGGIIVKANILASERSGDPSPEFVRFA